LLWWWWWRRSWCWCWCWWWGPRRSPIKAHFAYPPWKLQSERHANGRRKRIANAISAMKIQSNASR
jgi:hypothetical protein